MSLFCFCVVEGIEKSGEIASCKRQLEALAKRHRRRIRFYIDWPEPIADCFQTDSFVMNLSDGPESTNCEFLLLPDGWFYNGLTDRLPFRERMGFLQDICNFFLERNRIPEFYLGESGTLPEEFLNVILKSKELTAYLTKTIGVDGVEAGVHISVIP